MILMMAINIVYQVSNIRMFNNLASLSRSEPQALCVLMGVQLCCSVAETAVVVQHRQHLI